MTRDSASAASGTDGTLEVSETGPSDDDRPQVADVDHFRVIDDHRRVLIRKGATVLPRYASLDAVPAVLVDGVYVPESKPKRKGKS